MPNEGTTMNTYHPLRALATAARFAGHFVVACVTVAVLGGDTEH
jgi:hypothetical protein